MSTRTTRSARRYAGALMLGLALVAGACASTNTAGRLSNDTFEARKRLTRELVARQDWPTAFFYADQLHRERPDDAEVLVLRGTIYHERNLPAEAEADLREALAKDDRFAEAHAAMGVLYDMTGRGGEAESHHQRANGLAPHHPGFLNNLGFSLFLRKKYDEAIAAYQKAVRLAPTNRRIRTNLGFAYAGKGDMPRAAREFDMGGTPAEAKNNLGYAYERRGALGQAFSLYLEAVKLNPRSDRARANLAYVAKKIGKTIPADVAEQQPPTEGRSNER